MNKRIILILPIFTVFFFIGIAFWSVFGHFAILTSADIPEQTALVENGANYTYSEGMYIVGDDGPPPGNYYFTGLQKDGEFIGLSTVSAIGFTNVFAKDQGNVYQLNTDDELFIPLNGGQTITLVGVDNPPTAEPGSELIFTNYSGDPVCFQKDDYGSLARTDCQNLTYYDVLISK